MATKDLTAKYGGNSKQAINRAIRAECPGGAEALDALERLHNLVRGGNEAAGAGLDEVRQITAAMEAEIRRRYGMPQRKD